MPNYVEWTRNSSGRRINTHTIDREICAWWQVKVSKTRYHQMYDSVSLCAITVNMRYGTDSLVNEWALNAYLKSFSDDYPESPQFKSFCREFLIHRYTVRTWYSWA